MVTNVYPSLSRGQAEHGWLHSKFLYSFAEYYNPERMGFGLLRVLNDDIVEPGEGFGTHSHKNMEIISIPLFGSLEHRDNTGSGSVLKPGEVQVMSAGTGIMHSEYNPSDTQKTNFLQIWIIPKLKNVAPRYDQKMFDPTGRLNNFQLIVSPEIKKETLFINQDAYISIGRFDVGIKGIYKVKKDGNGLVFFVISGAIEVDRKILQSRDTAEITNVNEIEIKSLGNSEVLLIDVPMVDETVEITRGRSEEKKVKK
jgi:redox-sensitive bicupin YhaK (pirin superfamily)